jgi:DUF4097 and DUF4098 domain-containing protein YvlB
MSARTSLFRAALLLAVPWAASAQTFQTVTDDDWCHEGRSRSNAYCEVREATLPADRETIVVDGGRNGGVSIEGWDRNEIRVRAKLSVHRLEGADGAELASRIEIETDGEIRADGPSSRHDEPSWSVSFELMVPRKSNLSLTTSNGGITIVEVTGEIDFSAKNGGIRLARLGGDVVGATTNGGVSIRFDGDTWSGDGLDVVTTNGGVDLEIPEDYSARLAIGTVNGRIRSDLGPTDRRSDTRSVSATLGDGGPPLRIRTTNGGVTIRTT